MSWLSPWLALGLGTLAVPLLVHMVARESRTGRPFPSLMFLERVPFTTRRRKRLRDLPLLAARAAALAATRRPAFAQSANLSPKPFKNRRI